LHREIK